MLVSRTGKPTALDGDKFDYAAADGAFDETISRDGGIRPHWRVFIDQMDTIGLTQIRRRWEEAQHLIRENGVTYNVYGDARGMERPWVLDPIPLLIAASEATAIESSLIQRARLLDRVLADLYGRQTLLTGGFLPPELVFGHPGFLRPCRGLKVPDDRYLHLYAADLARSPDGTFHVLRDRTQAPSGAGYALENRIVLSRMLPETFRDCRVQRLAPFFRTLRETMRSIAPRNRVNPRIVLLTPGPYNETYFEHAFLARYLGYTLVEGGDLTVRDNRVFLKLLGGLQPVDVILRRVDDDYCDPLELRGNSFLGVPGLLQAVRADNVAVANALGSGLLESPALPAFLPALCRHLLGEELKMGSVPTWWCGDPRSMDHVLADFSRMVIKPTFFKEGTTAVFVATLDNPHRLKLAEKIRARPIDYVAQEETTLSTTPVLVGDRLKPRHILVRSFLVASGSTFVVMPGGLTRVAGSDESLVVSMQKGSGSKDTWVLSQGPVSEFTLLSPTVVPVEVNREGGDLPSRAADDLFWLGRYVERTEGTVRLLRAIFVRLTEKSGLIEVPDLPCLLRALSEQTKTLPGFVGPGSDGRIAAPLEELFSVLFDDRHAGGLAGTIDSLHRVAGRVRDRISTDMWRIIMSLDLPPSARQDGPGWNREPFPRRDLSEVLHLLDQKVLSLASFGGMVAESMTRGQGWRFLDMGRRLERSLQILGLFRSTLVTAGGTEGPLFEALLEILDSSMTYRRRYMSGLQLPPLLDLLIADEDNPRSLAFQFVALSQSIANLPKTHANLGPSPEQILIAAALTRLRSANVGRLVNLTPGGRRAELERFLAMIEAEIPLISESLTRTYLTHLHAARQHPTDVN